MEYQKEGSNWAVDKIIETNIHVVNYNPVKGSMNIPLPAKLANKKAVINIQNTDQKCFMRSVLASLYPIRMNPQRFNHYVQYVD